MVTCLTLHIHLRECESARRYPRRARIPSGPIGPGGATVSVCQVGTCFGSSIVETFRAPALSAARFGPLGGPMPKERSVPTTDGHRTDAQRAQQQGIGDLLRRSARRTPGKTALVFGDRR